MTLRGRLTLAFLLVVMGPLLLSAITVGALATMSVREREDETLADGAANVGHEIRDLCRRVQSAANGAAIALDAIEPEKVGRVTDWALDQVHFGAVRITRPDGTLVAARATVGINPPADWGNCTSGTAPGPFIAGRFHARDAAGAEIALVEVAILLDNDWLKRLEQRSGIHAAVVWPNLTLGDADVRNVHETTVQPAVDQPLQLRISTPRRDLRGLYATLVIVTIAVVGTAMLAASVLARGLTRPLAELAHAAEQVGIGNLSTRVPVRGDDEIARLARTFNRTVHDLQKYVGALRASRDQLRGNLTSLGQALRSGRDPAAILELTVQTAMSATGAHAGIVLLTEPASRRGEKSALVGKYASGLPEGMEADDVQLRFGEGMLGHVAASGSARRGRVDAGESDFTTREPHCRTYIAVPFQPHEHVGEPLGVLALYDRLGAGDRADDFDDDDVETLQNFATQAATALSSDTPTQPGNSSL